MTSTPDGDTLQTSTVKDSGTRHRLAAVGCPRPLAQISVLAGVSGVMSTIPSSPVVQSLLLLVLITTGAGSAALCWVNIPAGAAGSGVIGVSLAAVVILTTTTAQWELWRPVESCVILSAMVACSGLVRLWSLRRSANPISGIRPRPVGVGVPLRATFPLALAIALWLLSLSLLAGADIGQYGLLGSAGGVLLMLAAAAVVTSFVSAMILGRRTIAALAILMMVCVGRVTATLLTEVPTNAYTYKHIGVVDYVLTEHALAPYWTDVYVRWPGFFTTMAWFSSITGLDPMNTAHWFAVVTDIVIAIVVAALAFGVTKSKDVALVAALVVQVVNWVGQDYYSPQALSLIMAFSILSLLLCSRDSDTSGYVSIPIFAAMVATHQLTPVWVCAVVAALALFRLAKPRWLPIVYVGVWAIYVIPRLDSVMQYGIFNFDPLANSAGSTLGVRTESAGYQFTVIVDRILTVGFWVLPAVCVVVLWRRGARPWAAAICAFSPMLLIAGQSYGGEVSMRVFLFSLAGCSTLIAWVLVDMLSNSKAAPNRILQSGVLALLTAFALAGLHGYYSSWSFSTITRTQVEQSRMVLSDNRNETVITVWASSAGWPARPSSDYVKFALADSLYDVPLDELRHSILADVPDSDDMAELEAGPNSTGHPMYVVLPRQLYAYDAWIGLFVPGVLDGLKHQIETRPGWTEEINDADTVVYRYSPEEEAP